MSRSNLRKINRTNQETIQEELVINNDITQQEANRIYRIAKAKKELLSLQIMQNKYVDREAIEKEYLATLREIVVNLESSEVAMANEILALNKLDAGSIKRVIDKHIKMVFAQIYKSNIEHE